MRRFFILLGLLACTLPLSGCLDGHDAAAPSPTAFQGAPLKPGDLLNIAVAGEDELNGQYLVQDDRTVAMPLIGSVKVDTDLPAFEVALRQRLVQGLLKNPVVTVTLVAKPRSAGLPPPPGIRPGDTSAGSY